MTFSEERHLPIIAAAVAIIALGWFFLDGSTMRSRVIRSRLALVVQTPEGERSGSSVTQDTIRFPGGITKAQGWSITYNITGEAVVVDMGPRGLLFATLRKPSDLTFSGAGGSGGGYNANMMQFPEQKFRGDISPSASGKEKFAAYVDELDRLKPKSDLALGDVPVLVRFGDPNDPKSISLVDPRDLAASFGAGVILKLATVEITDDAVTTGIEARLPWLKSSQLSDPLFPNPTHQPRQDRRLVQLLTYDDFRSPPR
jgi:hypothetical protein